MEFLTLSNGVKMPQEGFGVFQIPDHKEAKRCVLDALDTGYRLIDTAAAYMNENAVGEAVRESGVKREDVFVTSKVWVQDMSYEGAERAIDASLSKLGFDYLDLMLLHQPMGDYYGAWRALEEAYKAGKLRAIGMANCYPQVIADMCLTVDIKPMVNQVELHPFFQQQLNLDTMKEFGVVPQAWGPFAEGNHNIFNHPVLSEIGKKYGKSAAQAALRWNIQRGVSVIPKSTHKERMEQNISVWDFELSQEDMEQITKLDIGHSEIVDHYSPEFVKMLHSLKIHD
ncbi:MAG TPA: aldo/keto reductase [Candidatus Eubacterium faecavium]|nr:aldo/keto reductase [Candidatus Eubacterium faecavium]